MSVDRVIDELRKKQSEMPTGNLLVTGGEPLLQQQELGLILQKTMFKNIGVETNGSILPIYHVAAYSTLIFDYKLTSSGMKDRMLPIEDFCRVPRDSWIKFVACNEEDLFEAFNIIRLIKDRSRNKINFAISPTNGLTHAYVFKALMEEHLEYVVLNAQLHKLLRIPECD